MKPYRTSTAQFRFFTAECKRLRSRWGLNDLKVYYQHERLKNAYANLSCDSTSRIAVIRLAKNWDDRQPTRAELRESARHELCHLLLDDLYDLARGRRAAKRQITQVAERTARRIEPLLP